MGENISEEYKIESEEVKAINWVKVCIISSVLLTAIIILIVFIPIIRTKAIVEAFFILPFILLLLIIVVLVLYYMLPTDIAIKRGMPKGELSRLRFFNIILGFTVIGWYLAFQWAISYPPRQILKKKENDGNIDIEKEDS